MDWDSDKFKLNWLKWGDDSSLTNKIQLSFANSDRMNNISFYKKKRKMKAHIILKLCDLFSSFNQPVYSSALHLIATHF